MEEEVWKDIIIEKNGVLYDYTGIYQVSNLGRIRSLDRITPDGRNINDLQMQKIQEDIIEKRLDNAWINIKNEEDIAKLRHDIQMDLYDLDINDRQQNYEMSKGIIDSVISLIKPSISK